jgi:hypothetical protein
MAYDQRWPARADALLQDLADALGPPVVYARDCAWQPHGDQ